MFFLPSSGISVPPRFGSGRMGLRMLRVSPLTVFSNVTVAIISAPRTDNLASQKKEIWRKLPETRHSVPCLYKCVVAQWTDLSSSPSSTLSKVTIASVIAIFQLHPTSLLVRLAFLNCGLCVLLSVRMCRASGGSRCQWHETRTIRGECDFQPRRGFQVGPTGFRQVAEETVLLPLQFGAQNTGLWSYH